MFQEKLGFHRQLHHQPKRLGRSPNPPPKSQACHKATTSASHLLHLKSWTCGAYPSLASSFLHRLDHQATSTNLRLPSLTPSYQLCPSSPKPRPAPCSWRILSPPSPQLRPPLPTPSASNPRSLFPTQSLRSPRISTSPTATLSPPPPTSQTTSTTTLFSTSPTQPLSSRCTPLSHLSCLGRTRWSERERRQARAGG